MEDKIIHISFTKIDFKCPYCDKQYIDTNDKYFNRANKNKSWCTYIGCECKNKFGLTWDMTGKPATWKKK